MRARLLLAVLALLPAAEAHAAETVRVTMAAIATYYAPYLVAIEKGYYAHEGLALDITYAGGGAATPALLSGTMDVSTSPAAALTAIMRGAALKVVYTMADRCQFQLWSTQPDLRTLKDLKGKTVGILSIGDTFEIAMRLTLLDAGLPQNWVGYTPLGVNPAARIAAIQSGALPAVIIAKSDLSPLEATNALKRGHLIADMEHTIRWPYTGLVVADRFIRERPQTLAKFLRATVEGVRYVKAYRTETIAVLKKYEPHASEQQIESDYDDSRPALTADGTVSNDLIARDLEVRAATLDMPKDKIPAIADIYDYAPLRAVTRQLDGWKPQR